MSYNFSRAYKQILLINNSCALRNIGEYKKALEQLEQINIDKYAVTLPITKIVYYNNLADIYICLNEIEKAEVWLNKTKQLLYDFRNEKLKALVSTAIQITSADIKYREQKYSKSIDLLNNVSETNMQQAIGKHLLFAKIYIAQDKIEEAKTKLEFVIENGNKLIDVQIAKDLLKNILY